MSAQYECSVSMAIQYVAILACSVLVFPYSLLLAEYKCDDVFQLNDVKCSTSVHRHFMLSCCRFWQSYMSGQQWETSRLVSRYILFLMSVCKYVNWTLLEEV